MIYYHMHSFICSSYHIPTSSHLHTHTHAQTHTHARTNTHACTHKHTHTHAHSKLLTFWTSSLLCQHHSHAKVSAVFSVAVATSSLCLRIVSFDQQIGYTVQRRLACFSLSHLAAPHHSLLDIDTRQTVNSLCVLSLP